MVFATLSGPFACTEILDGDFLIQNNAIHQHSWEKLGVIQVMCSRMQQIVRRAVSNVAET